MNNGVIGRRAHDPFAWLKQARELDQAAMLVWTAMREDLARLSGAAVGSTIDLKQAPNANLGGVFWLTAGLALETLLKGIIVQADPASVVNGTITNPLKTHNLLRLATRASVPLDPVEGFFLWVGTECVSRWPEHPGRTSLCRR